MHFGKNYNFLVLSRRWHHPGVSFHSQSGVPAGGFHEFSQYFDNKPACSGLSAMNPPSVRAAMICPYVEGNRACGFPETAPDPLPGMREAN